VNFHGGSFQSRGRKASRLQPGRGDKCQGHNANSAGPSGYNDSDMSLGTEGAIRNAQPMTRCGLGLGLKRRPKSRTRDGGRDNLCVSVSGRPPTGHGLLVGMVVNSSQPSRERSRFNKSRSRNATRLVPSQPPSIGHMPKPSFAVKRLLPSTTKQTTLLDCYGISIAQFNLRPSKENMENIWRDDGMTTTKAPQFSNS
jgi:hypothetical protein